MDINKEARISYWAHHLTTVVSVTFVLLLLGVIALIWIAGYKETERLRGQVEVNVLMQDSVPAERTKSLATQLARRPWCAGVTVISKEEALNRWERETGENLETLFGVNPLGEEIAASVRPAYSSSAGLARIQSEIGKREGVESVSVPDAGMVDAMNENIGRLTLVLAIVAGIMAVISCVLINNTVHLAVYARRFTIHTMQLVGATDGFIRRPFVVNNMLAGLLAGLLASAVIAVGMAGAKEASLPDIASYIGWGAYGIVAGGMVVCGVLLCGVASWIASTRYLHRDYDRLFR